MTAPQHTGGAPRFTGAALDATRSVLLAQLDREGFVESQHLGAAAVVRADGTVERSVGDIDATILPRSTLKPVQAIGMLAAGAHFADDELVLATASHCGSPRHTAVVERMLVDDHRDATDLQCPVQPPLALGERAALRARGGEPSRLTMNCSGKHAGMLRAADALGADPATYLAADHPVQQLIAQTVEHWTGEAVRGTTADGCGAPLHATSLRGLARAIARIAIGESTEAAHLMAAVQAQPWAIDGDGRANTVAIERLGGIAKLGAEGLVVIGTPSGVAVAVKVLDGSMRATTPVALTLLASVGAIDADAAAELIEMTSESVLGGDRRLGSLSVLVR